MRVSCAVFGNFFPRPNNLDIVYLILGNTSELRTVVPISLKTISAIMEIDSSLIHLSNYHRHSVLY